MRGDEDRWGWWKTHFHSIIYNSRERPVQAYTIYGLLLLNNSFTSAWAIKVTCDPQRQYVKYNKIIEGWYWNDYY